MSWFVIGDLHLSLSSNKPMDIFHGWDNYVTKLEENWQKSVKPDDTVVLAGDLSWGMSLEDSLEDFKFVDKLNGRKIILKGNHDYWWTTKSKTERFFSENGLNTLSILHNNCFEYENIGICGTRGWINENGESADKKVLKREAMRLESSIVCAEKQGLLPVVFLHYPPVFKNDFNYEILDVLQNHNIKHCFYGHIHGKSMLSAVNGNVNGIEYRLISSDFLQFSPLDISYIVQNDKK